MMGLSKLGAPFGWFMDKTRLSLPADSETWANTRKALLTSIGALGIAFVLLVLSVPVTALVWYGGTHPEPSRFLSVSTPNQPDNAAIPPGGARTSTGRIIAPLNAAQSPRMSVQRMQQWLIRSMMQIFSFNMNNADQVMENARWLFRPDAYAEFLKDVHAKGGLLESVSKNGLVVSFTSTSTVRVVATGQLGDKRVWKTELHAVLFFSGATAEGNTVQHVLFQVTVQEADPTVNPYGLQIVSIHRSSDQ